MYISAIKVKYKTFEGEKVLKLWVLTVWICLIIVRVYIIIQVPVIDSDDDQTLRIIILTAFYLKVLYRGV